MSLQKFYLVRKLVLELYSLRALLIFLPLALIPYPPALATGQFLSGTVITGGSKGNEAVMIEQKILSSSQKRKPIITHLCKDSGENRVKKLSGLKVRLSGSYRPKGNGERRCFVTNEFTVLKMSSGRPPLIGVLSQKDGYFHLTTDAGKLIKLNQKSGMEGLLNKRVILDVKPSPPLAEGVSPRVASYLEYP